MASEQQKGIPMSPDDRYKGGFVAFINARHYDLPPYVPHSPEEMERQKREYLAKLADRNGVHWS